MHFTRFAPAAAGMIGAANALLDGVLGGESGSGGLVPAVLDLANSWDDEVLFDGTVGVDAKTGLDINFGLNLHEAQVEGDIKLGALENFATEGLLRLDLAGVKAYVELDLSASAAVYQTVELVASPQLSVDAGLLELDLAAAIALDLVVGVGAAVDLTAGFYVSFNEGDFLELSILTKEVVGKNIGGMVTKALPVGVGAEVDLSAEIEIQLGLRLRSHISVDAGVELLDLDILEAGAEIALWADLLSHTMVLVETSECVVAIDSKFALAVGLAVDLSASVLDILDISLSPDVTITLAKAIGAQVCMPNRGETGGFLEPAVEPSAATTTSAPAASATGDLVTSTFSSTKTYTITSCHASVPNCPASSTQKIVTSTIQSTVTVCPADQTEAPVQPTSSKTKKPVHTITETLTTVVPCEPTKSTFTPGPSAPPVQPTVTITGTTSVCPSETSEVPSPPATPTGGVPVTPTESPSSPPNTPVVPSSPVETPSSPASPPVVPSSPVETPSSPAETPVVPSVPAETPSSPANTPVVPSVPAETPSSPNTPVVPQQPSQAPSVPPSPPVVTSVPAYPPVNSTMTSIVPPGSTWVPPPGVTPSQPPQAGAGSIKVGFALALPVVAAMML